MKNNYYAESFEFKVRPLGYDYAALEPYIDEKTMIIHHDRHLKTYVDKLNAALKDYPQYQNWSLLNLIALNNSLPASIKTEVLRNGGGVFNHVFFFDGMSGEVADRLGGERIRRVIDKTFGSMQEFKAQFKREALSVFGSGYAYLVLDKRFNLQIISTKNQMTPISENLYPLLNIDVWEHAYYLKNYNDRSSYIDAFFNVINWKEVTNRLIEAEKSGNSAL